MIDHFAEQYLEYWSDLEWMKSVGLGMTIGGRVFYWSISRYGGWHFDGYMSNDPDAYFRGVLKRLLEPRFSHLLSGVK